MNKKSTREEREQLLNSNIKGSFSISDSFFSPSVWEKTDFGVRVSVLAASPGSEIGG